MTKEIIQQSEEWLAAKMSKIGASEIFTLVAHYCKAELKQANIDLTIKKEEDKEDEKEEKAYKTALELFLKIKFQIQDDSFNEVNREFGLGMEEYILYRLGQEEKFKERVQFEGSKDFVVNEKLSHLASCSPDGYITNSESAPFGFSLRDYDDSYTVTDAIGQGVLELKTVPYFFKFKANDGLKFSYIFQLQYQMLVCDKKWGILAAIAPREQSYDTDFFKGKVLGRLDIANNYPSVKKQIRREEVNDYYNLYHYIYPKNKTIQNLCILALERFQKALDDNILPDLSIGCLVRLQREKLLLAKMYPDRYGVLKADEILDGLLKDQREANIQALKDKTDRQTYICEIIKLMGSHQELVGSESTAKFIKDGSLRFYKVKEKK